MNRIGTVLFGLLIGIFGQNLQAQESLESVERTLSQQAREIFTSKSFAVRVDQNKAFTRLLMETLARPESYKYDFDSLQTISILRAEDDAFRVFTWQVVYVADTGSNVQYGEQVHYYFGLIQRKFVRKDGKVDYIVIPLKEMDEIPDGIENMVLDNNQWLGGLYYPPKYQKEAILRERFKYYDRVQEGEGFKIKKFKKNMYILMGWSGLDNRSNMKFVDVLSFDPKDSARAVFGANVFYFDPVVAKHRAIFRYSEYAPFSLNYAYVKYGLLGRKKLMLVFDHLASPRPGERQFKEIWELGPDGSYDALYFEKGSGSFTWYKNIELAESYNNKITRKLLEEQRLKEIQRLKDAGIDITTSQDRNN